MSFGADELAELCKFVEWNAERNWDVISDQSIEAIGVSLARSNEMLAATITKMGIL